MPELPRERIQALGRSIKLKTLTHGFDNLDPWRSIGQCSSMPIDEAVEFFASLELTPTQELIAAEVLKEVRNRLSFLQDVGLGYLSLDRGHRRFRVGSRSVFGLPVRSEPA